MKIVARPRERGDLPIGASLLALLCLLPWAVDWVERDLLFVGACSIRETFDIPCLTCGGTRATVALVHGRMWEAFALQPMIISLYAVIAAWGSVSGVLWLRGRAIDLRLSPRESLLFKVSLIGVPLLNWCYLFWADI